MPSANKNNPSGLPTAPDPSTLGGAPTKSPYGVPDGYEPPSYIEAGSTTFESGSPMIEMLGIHGERVTQFGTPINEDPYMPGDNLAPLSDPSSIPQLQQRMIDAGLLSETNVRWGLWDEASASAYANVLGFANQYGLRATDALSVLVDNPQADASARQQRTISFTNPQDVKSGFQNISQQMTGQEQPTEQFASAFHAQEAAQNRDPTADYTQAPSVQGSAQQYLLENNRQDVLNFGVASRMQSFFDLLRQG